MSTHIVVRGARVHNLRGVDVELPRGRFVVVTGPSGSGKSSLVFDTIHAEAQRRYLVSLRSHARAFAMRLPPPDVDAIDGLTPTVALRSEGLGTNPRSTVGTLTEAHDFVRLLFARLGMPHCPVCGVAVKSTPVAEAVRTLLELAPGTRLSVLAPIARGERGYLIEELGRLRKEGFARARLDGVVVELDGLERAKGTRAHDLDVVVDRVVVRPESRARIAEAVELAYRAGRGRALATFEGGELAFAERPECASCGRTLPAPSLGLFSWNDPVGACATCTGLGVEPHEEPERGREDDEPADEAGELDAPCPSCAGLRLRPESLAVRVADLALSDVLATPLDSLGAKLAALPQELHAHPVAGPPLREITSRITFLANVGLGYLSLARSVPTLSGGEAMRARLASLLGAGLEGVTYVLDEPTAGLHPADVDALVGILERLRDRGNTLLVVEHDATAIRRADHLVDVGPGAGPNGGRVVASGTPEEVARVEESPTGRWLRGERPRVRSHPRPRATATLRLEGVTLHNLQDVSVAFPVGRLTCVTGVSGSGKSSLVGGALVPWMRHLLTGGGPPRVRARVSGHEHFDKLIDIDQRPIGRSARSTPASYVGAAPVLRELFAALPDARTRGYGPARFSPNVKGGRCETCAGEGVVRVDMHLLPDVTVICETCNGTRFSEETLAIRHRGRSIADVLAMSVEDALRAFEAIPQLEARLSALSRVGLGYLTLGQSATTLSGGEAQRVKLARELARRATGRTLYVLDEPTAGLHFDDVAVLVDLLEQLVDAGNTVLVVEHHLDVVRRADHVVDLGPGAGPLGGRVVAQGSPEEVMMADASITGKFLESSVGR